MNDSCYDLAALAQYEKGINIYIILKCGQQYVVGVWTMTDP
jgi:hypothetical protein